MTLTVQKLTQYADHSSTYLYKNVSLKFETARFYVIIGQKDFMFFLAGLASPDSGTINFNGKNILKIGVNKYRSEQISLLAAENNLFDYMTPLENIMSALAITKSKHAGSKRYAMDVLSKAGISSTWLQKTAADLPLEQRQLTALARALAVDAPIILADDLTKELDQAAAKRLVAALLSAAHKWKKTVIMTSDDESLATESDVSIRLLHQRFAAEKNF